MLLWQGQWVKLYNRRVFRDLRKTESRFVYHHQWSNAKWKTEYSAKFTNILIDWNFFDFKKIWFKNIHRCPNMWSKLGCISTKTNPQVANYLPCFDILQKNLLQILILNFLTNHTKFFLGMDFPPDAVSCHTLKSECWWWCVSLLCRE